MIKAITPLHVIKQMNDEHLRKAIYHLEVYMSSQEWDSKDYLLVEKEILPIIGTLREKL